MIELLNAAQPIKHGIEKIVVWGAKSTLDCIDDRAWLTKLCPPELNAGLLRRSLWQRFKLAEEARKERCDVLFVPGGSYAGNFHPVVAMSQNLLPFEFDELKRYGFSLMTLKLLLLRLIQSHSYRKVDGLIFLTEYAQQSVLRITGPLSANITIIPHGLNPRFNQLPKPQRAINDYSVLNPYHVLYVSIIDQYKHQWHVVEAIAALRLRGFPLVLDLVGPHYPPSLKRLKMAIARHGGSQTWVHYHGAIPFNELHLRFARADMGLFASSCENMPNILLETMASGLPIACSNRGPMPSMLGSAGVFFDPENSDDIAFAIETLIESPKLRDALSLASYRQAQHYSWQCCAEETFRFLAAVVQ